MDNMAMTPKTIITPNILFIREKMRRKKITNKKVFFLFGILFSLCLISLINAEVKTLGIFKQNDCVSLLQTCGNCSYVNITSVLYPNSTQALGLSSMTQIGTVYNYTFCDTSTLGDYIVNGVGDINGVPTVWAYDFMMTPNGQAASTPNALFYFGLIFLFAIVLISCVYSSWRVKKSWVKLLFMCVSYLSFVIITFIIWRTCVNFMSAVSFIPDITYMIWMISMVCFLPFIIFTVLFILDLGAKELKIATKINMGYTREEAENGYK
jgi:hypothetical protein